MSTQTDPPPLVTCRLSHPLPNGTIDSHMHIIPPDFSRFPIKATAQYKPTPHTLSDATTFYQQTSGLGITTPRLVLTQVSIYGTDNSALLNGLADLGPNGRGVVEFDPDSVNVDQLRTWWEQGVRGARINLVSVGKSMVVEDLQRTLQSYVSKLAQHELGGKEATKAETKWVVEMYLPLNMVSLFLEVLPTIKDGEKVRWCLDHFGGLKWKDDAPDFKPSDDPYTITGFSELMQLLTDQELPEVFIKISAQYRLDPEYPSALALERLGVIGRELVRKAEHRVMWASDWPHTRFGDIDSIPFVEACYAWCGDGEQGMMRREKLFRLNAEVVWDM